MTIIGGSGIAAPPIPVAKEPTLKETKRLYELLATSHPSPALDAHIACWMNGYTMHATSDPSTGFFQFWDKHVVCHDCADWPLFTSDMNAALSLVVQKAPDLALILLRHPNRHWSVAWSNDGAPRLDEIHFDEAFLPLAIVASLVEAMIDREMRKQ